MKIGIDIDGVLTDEHTYIIDNCTKFFSENKIPYVIHKDIYDSAKIFEVSEEDYILFWKEYFINYITKVPTRRYAKKVIKKLKEENNEIIIITARPFTSYKNKYTKQMQDAAINWLNKNGIIYDKIVFSENKVDTCKKLNINVMIEDKPEHIHNISKILPVICYDNPFNEKLSNKNIYRCYSWYDIYEKIQIIKDKTK